MEVINLYKTKAKNGYYFIGRGSALSNPFTHLPLKQTKARVQVATREEAIKAFDEWLRGDPKWAHVPGRDRALFHIKRLRSDEILGCYCAPKSCHGDMIIQYWRDHR